jgi:hypothetical protein
MGCFCKFRLSIDLMQMICLDHVGGERTVDVSVQQTSLIHHIFRSRTVICSDVFSRLCIVKLRLVVDLIAESYCSLLELLLKAQGEDKLYIGDGLYGFRLVCHRFLWCVMN